MIVSSHSGSSSLNLTRNLFKNTSVYVNSVGKLSSGTKILTAADDASGMSISNKFSVQLKSWHKIASGLSEAMGMLKNVDEVLGEQADLISKMKSLVIQGNNGYLSENDKQIINEQISQYTEQLNQLANSVKYNGISLMNSVKTEGSISLNSGASDDLSDTINGSSIAFSGTNPIDIDSAHTITVEGIRNYISDIDTSGISGEIVTKYSPKWADNNTIYFTMDDTYNTSGSYSIYSINKDGTGFTEIDTTGIPGGSNILEIDVSDQGYIAAVLSDGSIYTNKSGNFTALSAPNISSIQGISWDPTGTKLVYATTTATQLQTWNVDTDTSAGIINGGGFAYQPKWANDGYIYFSNGTDIRRANDTTYAVDGAYFYDSSTQSTLGGPTRDYFPTVESGRILSNTSGAGAVINASSSYSGTNAELSPDGTTAVSIDAAFLGAGRLQLASYSGAGGASEINDVALKSDVFEVSPYLTGTATVGSETYTFTYSEAANEWSVQDSQGTNIGSYSPGGLVDIGNLGLMVQLKDTERVKDGDSFSVSTEAEMKITLDNGDYTIYDSKDNQTIVTNENGGYATLSFGSSGPKAGTYNFEVQGTESVQHESLSVFTSASLNSSYTFGLPQTFTAESLNISNASVTNSFYADESIKMYDRALNTINSERAEIGAKIKGLNSHLNSAYSNIESTTRSLSAIQDTDYAAEILRKTSAQLISDVGIRMLSESNVNSSALLSIFNNSDNFRDFQV